MSTEDDKLLKEAKKLPWDERLLHKNWKIRNDANIDLAAVCDSITDPKDPRLRDFGTDFIFSLLTFIILLNLSMHVDFYNAFDTVCFVDFVCCLVRRLVFIFVWITADDVFLDILSR